MADSFVNVVRSIDRFVDASRRFFIIAERWNNGFVNLPIDGVDWREVRRFEAAELKLSLQHLRGAIDRFRSDCDNLPTTLPAQWQTIIRSAANLADHACDDAAERGWFDGRHGTVDGSSVIASLRKSVQLLSFISDVVTAQGLSHAEREVLQVILENGPKKGDELAELTRGADFQGSTFREMLAGMVDDGLLLSGKGRYSTGYRLTDRGMLLAQLSGQLTDF